MACWPNGTKTRPEISSPFGERDGGWSSFHYGFDSIGYSVAHSVLPGTVIAVGVLQGWEAGGLQVVIDHGSGVISRSMHLADAYVSTGQRVSEAHPIGKLGKSGNATGICLHLEIRINGKAVDPVPWIRARLGETSGGTPAPRFPLPSGSYFGPKEGPAASVSGYYSHRDDLRTWQQRMHDRGWAITVDGYYGPNTRDIARRFQAEKGLTVDGLIGPATWSAAWTEPVT